MDFDQAADECLAGRVVRRAVWAETNPDRVMRVEWQAIPGLYHLVMTLPPLKLDPEDMHADDWVVAGVMQ